jgi:hypothetical protein
MSRYRGGPGKGDEEGGTDDGHRPTDVAHALLLGLELAAARHRTGKVACGPEP